MSKIFDIFRHFDNVDIFDSTRHDSTRHFSTCRTPHYLPDTRQFFPAIYRCQKKFYLHFFFIFSKKLFSKKLCAYGAKVTNPIYDQYIYGATHDVIFSKSKRIFLQSFHCFLIYLFLKIFHRSGKKFAPVTFDRGIDEFTRAKNPNFLRTQRCFWKILRHRCRHHTCHAP